ncbi:50S ribosomal protein L4 [Candidatus Saccharibacteria bacterium]|nr:50S ribosomal protein L4 [Candidatus Saccharibacteria bacterium]
MTEPTVKLNKEIYSLEVKNHELLKQAYDTYLANSRSSHAKTMTRAEVSGGGKKPWRQKGTGRARFGSTRNPIWRHGGIAFGRTGNENFEKSLSKTSKKVAVRQALSMKNADKAVVTIADFKVKDGKAKETIAIFAKNKIDITKNTLLVVEEKDELTIRATRNIATLKVVRPTYLNVFDIMNADKIVITEKSLPVIENWLLGKEAK